MSPYEQTVHDLVCAVRERDTARAEVTRLACVAVEARNENRVGADIIRGLRAEVTRLARTGTHTLQVSTDIIRGLRAEVTRLQNDLSDAHAQIAMLRGGL